MRDKEYDSFGPWILEVNEDDEIPPLFRNYLNQNKTRLFTIKVPRNIERQVAEAGMNLYDYLIVMYEEFLYILKRNGQEVKAKKVKYEDINTIKNKIILLQGILSIYLSDEIVSIKYNTVSEGLIDKLINMLKNKYLEPNVKFINNNINKEIKITEILYKNLCNHLKKDMDIQVIAFQPTIYINKDQRSFLNKIIYLLSKRVLQSSLYMTNGLELIILSREKQFKRSNSEDYGYIYTYIPLSNLLNIKFENNKEILELTDMIISTDFYSFRYLIDNTNQQIDNINKLLNS